MKIIKTKHSSLLGLSSSSNYSLSDDDDSLPFEQLLSNGQQSNVEKNMELEQSLKRLALLDKTQEEIEKISKVISSEVIIRTGFVFNRFFNTYFELQLLII